MRWPEGTRPSQKQHAINHVKSVYYAIDLCISHRTAVQAGGNIGLWPMAMAEQFAKVLTFEPDFESFKYLSLNVGKFENVDMFYAALGESKGKCSIEHRSLGSHRVIPGNDVPVVPLDDFNLNDVDLLQLDIEGYELLALTGARKTIMTSKPIIQIEMRDFSKEYGSGDEEIIKFMESMRYKKLVDRPGNDVIFRHVNY